MRRVGVLVLILSSVLLTGVIAKASDIDNSSSTCADVLLVFARGSGSNSTDLYLDKPFDPLFRTKEEVPGSFFQAFQSKMDNEYPLVTYKAVSVHNFPSLYNSEGYKAVGAFSAITS